MFTTLLNARALTSAEMDKRFNSLAVEAKLTFEEMEWSLEQTSASEWSAKGHDLASRVVGRCNVALTMAQGKFAEHLLVTALAWNQLSRAYAQLGKALAANGTNERLLQEHVARINELVADLDEEEFYKAKYLESKSDVVEAICEAANAAMLLAGLRNVRDF